MCAIEYAEPCDIWNETNVRAARKPAQCSECRRTITIGEPYRHIKALSDRHWYTSRQCQHCCVGADWLSAECKGYMLDGVADEIREHAEEYRDAGLWRLVVGTKRRWQRPDGSLMPVPRMPKLSNTSLKGI